VFEREKEGDCKREGERVRYKREEERGREVEKERGT